MPAQIKRATKFNRIFDPEFLVARKDITELEVAVAEGRLDDVVAGIKAANPENSEEVLKQTMLRKNRDGNTLLLLAVANSHLKLTSLLLEMKSDIHHKNMHRMDALDYSCMESVTGKIAKEVIGACDYLVTEVIASPFEKSSRKAIVELLASGQRLARTSLLGKKPDFGALFSKETEYRKEWVSNLQYMAKLVRKGVILLDDDIRYLEKDALISGALEIPVNLRYLYFPATAKIMKMTEVLSKGGQYEQSIETRLVKTCFDGDATAVQGLLKAKAMPHTEDSRGESVLIMACQAGDVQTIKCLLVAKAELNGKNKEGYSALHVAACRNKPDAVEVLLKAKADLFSRSNKGHAVLDFVKHEGHRAVLSLIQQEREDRKEAKLVAKPVYKLFNW